MKIFSFFMIAFSVCQNTHFASAEELAQSCVDILCIRKHMDQINEQILNLIGERSAFVRRAGEIKGPHTPSDDPKRANDQLAWVKEAAKKKSIPLEIAVPTFKTLIQTSIEYQRKYKDDFYANHSTQLNHDL